MSKFIISATLKGGAGKTMILFNLAGFLAQDKKVLILDADPQGNITSNCGINMADRTLPGTKDIFVASPKEQLPLEQLIVKSPIEDLPNLDVIPSSFYMFRSDLTLINVPAREKVLHRYIGHNIDAFNEYDYILIDTNPSLSLININAFYVADEIILSSDISINGINGAEIFCELWDESREALEKEDNVAALVINNYERTTKLSTELLEYAREAEFSKDILCETIIPHAADLKRTELFNKPINLLYPTTKPAAAFEALVNELKEREVL